MLHRILLVLLGLALFCTLSAQELLTIEKQDSQFASVLNLVLPRSVEYDVQNYYVTYTTENVFGRPDTASGLLSVPLRPPADLFFPLAVYNHGTIGERSATISNPGVQERFIPVGMTASGYVTIAPDYLGFGVDEGPHPYVHAASEASAGRDMIIAVRDYLRANPTDFPAINNQLFVTGYSQGGHAAAALHRDIELNPGDDGLDVTSATYLSGPYSISDVMVSTIFADESLTLPGYIAYTYISYNYVYGLFDSLNEAFVPPYLEPISRFAAGETTLAAFNTELDELLAANNDQFNAIFQDSIREVLRGGDPNAPINAALAENDTYDWSTDDPVLIYYCTRDEQVPNQNAFLADSVLRANGSTAITLENGGPISHGACAIPAVLRSLEFWEDFAVLTSLGQPAERPEVRLFPNPVAAGTNLRWEGLPERSHPFALYDLSGRLRLRGRTDAGGVTIPAATQAGAYVVRIGLEDGTSLVRRILVH